MITTWADLVPWSPLIDCLERLERTLHQVITVRRKRNFPCDSHPWLCVSCHSLRYLIKYKRLPSRLVVMTRKGDFVWQRDRRLHVALILECPRCGWKGQLRIPLDAIREAAQRRAVTSH